MYNVHGPCTSVSDPHYFDADPGDKGKKLSFQDFFFHVSDNSKQLSKKDLNIYSKVFLSHTLNHLKCEKARGKIIFSLYPPPRIRAGKKQADSDPKRHCLLRGCSELKKLGI